MPKNAQIKQKKQLLSQSLLLYNWITQFDPVNINDCFDNSSLHRMPKGLRNFDPSLMAELKHFDSHNVTHFGGSAFRTTLNETQVGSLLSPKLLRKSQGLDINMNNGPYGRNGVMHMSVNGFDFPSSQVECNRSNLVTTNLDHRSSSHAAEEASQQRYSGDPHMTSYDHRRDANIVEEQGFQMQPATIRTSVKLNNKFMPKRQASNSMMLVSDQHGSVPNRMSMHKLN